MPLVTFFRYFKEKGFKSPNNDLETNHEVKKFENEIRVRLAIKRQIEYYFCEYNVLRDGYLQSVMDRSGYVRLDLICSFNRMLDLRYDYRRALADEKEDDIDKRFDELVVDVLSKSRMINLKFLSNEKVDNILKNTLVG